VSDDALEQALRAMRHRERSGLEVDRHLEARGVEEPERREVLEVLVRTGVVDDRRYAELRASSLASRGAGDALIRHELSRAGIEAEIVEGAVARLTSELERAQLRRRRRARGRCAFMGRRVRMTGLSFDVFPARTRFLNP
jgi:SOS response regulatory protein OraA/RecX